MATCTQCGAELKPGTKFCVILYEEQKRDD